MFGQFSTFSGARVVHIEKLGMDYYWLVLINDHARLLELVYGPYSKSQPFEYIKIDRERVLNSHFQIDHIVHVCL